MNSERGACLRPDLFLLSPNGDCHFSRSVFCFTLASKSSFLHHLHFFLLLLLLLPSSSPTSTLPHTHTHPKARAEIPSLKLFHSDNGDSHLPHRPATPAPEPQPAGQAETRPALLPVLAPPLPLQGPPHRLPPPRRPSLPFPSPGLSRPPGVRRVLGAPPAPLHRRRRVVRPVQPQEPRGRRRRARECREARLVERGAGGGFPVDF